MPVFKAVRMYCPQANARTWTRMDIAPQANALGETSALTPVVGVQRGNDGGLGGLDGIFEQ